MNGFIFRFACCQFGKATAHGPLNAYILSLIRHGASLTPALALRAWVDDILGSIRAKRHCLCTGFEGGCPDCAENFAASSVSYESFFSLCRQLGIQLSPGKGFPPAQSGEFTGLCLNTVNSTITAPPRKLAGILDCLLALRVAAEAPRQAIARAQGKIVHYRRAIPYLGCVTPAFSSMIGDVGVAQSNWDTVIPLRRFPHDPRLLHSDYSGSLITG